MFLRSRTTNIESRTSRDKGRFVGPGARCEGGETCGGEWAPTTRGGVSRSENAVRRHAHYMQLLLCENGGRRGPALKGVTRGRIVKRGITCEGAVELSGVASTDAVNCPVGIHKTEV